MHQYFVPPNGSGGTRSYEMARRFVAAGHRVTLITSSAFFPSDANTDGRVEEASLDGISLKVIRVPYSNRLGYGRRILAFFKFALLASWQAVRVDRPEVVFATSTPLTIAIPGVVARLWHRCPMVFEVRDLWPELPIAMGALPNPVMRWAARRLERLAYWASSRIVALSPGMRDGVRRTGYPEERIAVVPNSCDVELFRAVPESEDALVLPFPNGGPVVTYAGTFGAINGVEYLVRVAAQALEQDPGVRFLLVGDGAMRERVASEAAASGVLGRNLWIMEPVPKRLVPALMQATTIATSLFIDVPEMQNNSANKFFDGLAAGRPVAINYGGWQADLLRETGAGLVLPREAGEAAAMLVAFARDRAAIEAASRSAVRLASGPFSRDRLAQQLRTVLEQAAGEAGSRHVRPGAV
ncbi:glycosyltransferase family 4 protein [Anaeromyxobacter sp. Red801]|uniref:glycosyltransferase family 4 protein n=1 Tax=Anaeromyxobacter sp. Red801 TaxID=3411632 RepID=UPI003B9DDE13